MRWSFEVVCSPEKARLGESPFWDPETNDLWWVDVIGKRLLRTAVATGTTEVWDMPESPGFVVLTGAGAPAIGMETGIYAFAPPSGDFERLVRLEQAGSRFNDATVDTCGRLWASTMALDGRAGQASIHLVTADRDLQTFVTGLAIPNGLAVDLDRGRVLYSDSHPAVQCIWSMPLSTGPRLVGEAKPFAGTKQLRGRPDGAALSQDGTYWIAGVDGSELYAFDLHGQLIDAIAVPFPAPTKPCFAGPDGRMLWVTSKDIGEDGGHLARARLPPDTPAGIVQPYWMPG